MRGLVIARASSSSSWTRTSWWWSTAAGVSEGLFGEALLVGRVARAGSLPLWWFVYRPIGVTVLLAGPLLFPLFSLSSPVAVLCDPRIGWCVFFRKTKVCVSLG